MQELAHWRDASGPFPDPTISMMPVMTLAGLASAIPAGPTLGHTSTHLPHRVQASSMSSTRAPNAVSKETSCIDGRLWFSPARPSVAAHAVNRQGCNRTGDGGHL